MLKSRTIVQFFVVRLLIILSIITSAPSFSLGQDRIVKVDNTLEAPITYSCRDSIITDVKTGISALYGDAKVEYEGISLTADYIEMDMENRTVQATYTLDQDSNRVGIPVFSDGSEEVKAATLKYNFETKKAYIQELKVKQEENYLHMERAKRQTNGELHFVEGKFTTCDLDEPHYHFQLSKAVLVPNKRIVSGPLNLWIAGVPTPLGLPFIFLPTQEREQTGIIFPQLAFQNANLGMGFQDLGYFFPIKASDKIQTSLYASAYTSGTFGFKNYTQYNDRYKYNGSLELSFIQINRPFPDDSTLQNNSVIKWQHRQKNNANPYWNFSSDVNFQSSNDATLSTQTDNPDFLKSTLNSSINITRKFPSKPVTMGLKAAMKQNKSSGNIDMDLPVYTLNVNRFFPFKFLRRNSIGKERFYEKIGVTYNLEARNNTVFADSLIRTRDYTGMAANLRNGVKNSIKVTTAVPLLGSRFTLTPSINYNSRINLQGIDQVYDFSGDSIIETESNNYGGYSQDLSFTSSLTTSLYSYYRFVGKSKMKMRHVLTPSFNFSYTPDLSSTVTRTYITNTQDTVVLNFSPYQNSIYREGYSRETAVINYSFNNAFEFKKRVTNDTIDEDVKFRIIEALSFSGNYDFLKDSLNWSPVRANLRVKPFKFVSVVSSATFSLYAIDDFGQQQNSFAFRQGQSLSNLTQSDVSVTFTLASKESLKKIEETKFSEANSWNADYEYYRLHPEEVLNYEIPWKLNFSYNFYTSIHTDSAKFVNQRFNQNHTINMVADFSLTKRWKVGVNANYDISNKNLQRTVFSLNRDMHCWVLAFRWIPSGTGQSFTLTFNAKSNLFKDAKLNFTRPPAFL
ncbi:putative LPS assembly protein LptD [Lishizhenia sp.]|uniref:putative LPS assembly protein LptD n=1 Tax=Lishizhenia sp. TaxID=2497594 RepID=UPI00299DA185|nr:putative LPS assembly protein LptD [Lishizhenia sp.]MDX1444667.1 putative LPS assembly protein LptD [Lishizhenia sp.]